MSANIIVQCAICGGDLHADFKRINPDTGDIYLEVHPCPSCTDPALFGRGETYSWHKENGKFVRGLTPIELKIKNRQPLTEVEMNQVLEQSRCFEE